MNIIGKPVMCIESMDYFENRITKGKQYVMKVELATVYLFESNIDVNDSIYKHETVFNRYFKLVISPNIKLL